MADPTTSTVFASTALPAAGVAAILGIPVDAIFWAVFGSAIAVTRGPRLVWEFWPVVGAVGAFGMSIGVGSIVGALGGVIGPHFAPASWGLSPELMRISLGFSAALLAQQIVNRLGDHITRAKLPGENP